MEIRPREIKSLPQLAWCARIHQGRPAVEVDHGSSVEIREDFFYEGAWSGGEGGSDYLNSPFICGTGGAVQGSEIHFTASSDRICPLFSIKKGDTLHISNSPVFAMVSAGEQPHELYPFYFYDFVRYWRMGMLCSAGSLRLASRHRLQVHFNTIVKVALDGSVAFGHHRAPERPTDYASWHGPLLEGMKGLFANASDKSRKRPLVPLAAMSKGYDSTASAALAASAGCREAFSFRNSRYEDPSDDSGKENARTLGMECQEYDRWDYLNYPEVRDAEFGLFSVSLPLPMASMEKALEGRLLVTGHFGDVFLDCDSGLCDNLTMPWSRFLSGVGMLEFRLRTGFNVFTPAPVGGRHNQDVHRILFSEEMKPWWIKQNYNRPLARRIAEDAGLPREAFGMKKRGNGHANHGEREAFTEPGARAYSAYMESSHSNANKAAVLYWKARLALCHFLWEKFAPNDRKHRKYSKWQNLFPFIGNTPPTVNPWKFQFTFAWCHSVLRERYSVSETV